jgi:NAD(P)H dehydrogenase (quinone)
VPELLVLTFGDAAGADALAFGSPARFGNISARLKQFLDATSPLRAAGELTNEVATGFTSAGHLATGEGAAPPRS